MMKRILLIILAIITMVSSTSYAQERVTREDRQKRTAVVTAAAQVLENRATIKTLSEEVRIKTKLAKEKIQILSENRDSITQEQLTNLKTSVRIIKEHQKILKNTVGQIKAYDKDIRIARQNKNLDTLLRLYNEILPIQETRITHLKQYNEILDQLINNL